MGVVFLKKLMVLCVTKNVMKINEHKHNSNFRQVGVMVGMNLIVNICYHQFLKTYLYIVLYRFSMTVIKTVNQDYKNFLPISRSKYKLFLKIILENYNNLHVAQTYILI